MEEQLADWEKELAASHAAPKVTRRSPRRVIPTGQTVWIVTRSDTNTTHRTDSGLPYQDLAATWPGRTGTVRRTVDIEMVDSDGPMVGLMYVCAPDPGPGSPVFEQWLREDEMERLNPAAFA